MLAKDLCVLLMQSLENVEPVLALIEQFVEFGPRCPPTSVFDETLPVQAKAPERELSGSGNRVECSVGEPEQVAFLRLHAWIPEDRIIRIRRPVVGLVLVAPVAAVEQVFQVVCAVLDLWPKVVNGQFATRVGFRHATVLAREARPFAYALSYLG
jgi:hypothetical protein